MDGKTGNIKVVGQVKVQPEPADLPAFNKVGNVLTHTDFLQQVEDPGLHLAGGSKRKRQTISRTNTNKIEKLIIKDVILLPDPGMSAVLRGCVH